MPFKCLHKAKCQCEVKPKACANMENQDSFMSSDDIVYITVHFSEFYIQLLYLQKCKFDNKHSKMKCSDKNI